jgi:hypothetical protein
MASFHASCRPSLVRLHGRNGRQGLAQVANDQWFALAGGGNGTRYRATAEHIEHQNREVAGDGAAALAHQGWHGDAIGFTTFPHRGHHVVGVVLQGVVGGGCRGRAAAVVIDAQAAAHIQVAHWRAELGQLDIDLARFLQGVFEHRDVVDLAAHMEVEQA